MARRGHLRVLALAALLAGGCFGPHDLGVRPFRLVSSDFPLPSGLRVVFQRDATSPSVVVATVVGAGAAFDPPGKEGLAHLVEHLWFRSRREGGSPVAGEIERLGGVFNAATSWDETEFFTTAPRDALDPLLALEAQRLTDPLAGVDEAAFEIERDVTAGEIANRRETDAAVRLSETLLPMVFPATHPYHRPAGGTPASLAGLTLEDAKAFARAHYRPENATLVIAGDLDPAAGDRLIARHFTRALVAAPGTTGSEIQLVKPVSRIATGPPVPPPAPPDAAPASGHFRHVPGPVAATTVVLAWSLPGAYRESQPMIEAAVAALNGAVGAMRCGVTLGERSSLATCTLEVPPGRDPETVASHALDGLYQLWDARDLAWQARLYSYVRAGYVGTMIRDSASLWRTLSFARYVHYSGRADRFPRTIDDLARIDVRAERDFAWRWLNRERAVVLVVDPMPDGAIATSLPAALAAGTRPDAPPSAGEVGDEGVPQDPGAVARTAHVLDLQRLTRFTLPNGLRVVLYRHGAAPFLEAGLLTGGGWADENPLGIGALVVEPRIVDPGILAGEWRRHSWADGELVTIDGPSGNPAGLLRLLAARAAEVHPASPRDVEAIAGEMGWRQHLAEREPDTWAERRLWEALAPGHPLSRRRLDVGALRNAPTETIASWISTQYAPENATLFVVGDLDPDAVSGAVARTFGAWRRTDAGAPHPPLAPLPVALPARQVLVVDRPGASFARVTVACRLGSSLASGAGEELLEESLHEELFERLRERTGEAYAVDVWPETFRASGSVLFVRTEARAGNAPRLLSEIFDRLAALRERRLPASRLEKARWTLARKSWTRDQSAAEMLLTLAGSVREGGDPVSLASFGADLARASSEDLAELTAPCAGHEVAAVVGPADAVAPALAERGYDPQRVDRRQLTSSAARDADVLPPDDRDPEADHPAMFGRTRILLPWHMGPDFDFGLR